MSFGIDNDRNYNNINCEKFSSIDVNAEKISSINNKIINIDSGFLKVAGSLMIDAISPKSNSYITINDSMVVDRIAPLTKTRVRIIGSLMVNQPSDMIVSNSLNAPNISSSSAITIESSLQITKKLQSNILSPNNQTYIDMTNILVNDLITAVDTDYTIDLVKLYSNTGKININASSHVNGSLVITNIEKFQTGDSLAIDYISPNNSNVITVNGSLMTGVLKATTMKKPKIYPRTNNVINVSKNISVSDSLQVNRIIGKNGIVKVNKSLTISGNISPNNSSVLFISSSLSINNSSVSDPKNTYINIEGHRIGQDFHQNHYCGSMYAAGTRVKINGALNLPTTSFKDYSTIEQPSFADTTSYYHSIDKSGLYYVCAKINYSDATSAGIRALYLYKNATPIYSGKFSGIGYASNVISLLYNFSTGDLIRMYGYQNSGSNLNTGTSVPFNYWGDEISVIRMSAKIS